jgi:hypothetical protein
MPEVYHCDVVFCDDARVENNGKLILVGVYPGNILMAHFPFTMRLSGLIRIWNLPIGHHTFTFVVSAPGGKFDINGTADVVRPGNMGFPFGPIDITIDNKGELSVTGNIDGAPVQGFEPMPIMHQDDFVPIT